MTTLTPSKVIPGLYQGDRSDALAALMGLVRADLLVLAAAEVQPPKDAPCPRPPTLSVLLRDDEEPQERALAEAKHVAMAVADAVRDGKVCVVTCAMGLNRSGLVTALALVELGRTAEQAVELIRRARGPLALCNEAFLRHLQSHSAREPLE